MACLASCPLCILCQSTPSLDSTVPDGEIYTWGYPLLPRSSIPTWRQPRSLEQISTITPSERFKGNISLGFQRGRLRCFQAPRLSASTTQHTPFTDPDFSHSCGARPGLGQAERWWDSWPVRGEPPRSREAPHNPSITVCRQGVSLWNAWCMEGLQALLTALFLYFSYEWNK